MIGLDCEMVGLGNDGKYSALARACLVNFDGEVIYDKYVRPKGFITDFRTKYSGIRSKDMRKGEASTFEECQKEVADLLKGKYIVGHALHNDLKVLLLSHPRTFIRDTATYHPLMRTVKRGENVKYKPKALKVLAKEQLNLQIQEGEHDPGIDARSAMMLYRLHRQEWEKSIAGISHHSGNNGRGTSGNMKAKKKKCCFRETM